MRRTKWSAMAFLFSGLLVLGACTPAGESPSAEPAGSEPAASGSAPAGAASGQIVYAIDGQILTLGNAAADVPTAEASTPFFNGLYQYNTALEPVPDLAADFCEVTEEGLVYTCTLLEGITFHNGDELTADDVVFTYSVAQSANCRFNPSLCLSPFLESATAIDDLTVEFRLLEAYAPFTTVILPGLFIDSQDVVQGQYDEFAAEVEGIDAGAARTAADTLTAAIEADEPDPAACEAGLADVEGFLTESGLELPSRDDFALEDGSFDACGYGEAIAGALDSSLAALEQEGFDALAAVYPLLPFNREPVGTGPYMCEPGCFAPGESLTATAYPDYHEGQVVTETIFMPVITDEIAIANAVQAGEVDWHYSVPSDAWEALRDNPEVKFAEYPDFGYFSLQYNLREGSLFADIGARKAVQYCIDKAETVEVATGGQGVPVEATIPPASWAYNSDLATVERDVATAIGFLEEAGWTVEVDAEGNATGPATRGEEVFSTQVYVRAGQPERIQFMQLVRDQVAQCGIEFEVIEADFATVLTPLLDYPHIPPNSTEQFDAYFGGWSTGYDPDPFTLWHSSQCSTEELVESFNYICFQNDRADELIAAGLASSSQEERAEIYQEFEQIIYDEQPYLFAWSDLAREALDVNLTSTEGELQLDSPVFDWQLWSMQVAE